MEQNQRTNKGSPEVINGIKKISSNSVLFPPFQIQEWFGRAAKFDESAEAVNKLLKNLTTCNNRELLYDLYPYIWDIRSVISLLNSYVRWLGEYEQASVDFPEWNEYNTRMRHLHPRMRTFLCCLAYDIFWNCDFARLISGMETLWIVGVFGLFTIQSRIGANIDIVWSVVSVKCDKWNC